MTKMLVTLLLLFVFGATSFCQRERVYLALDKYSCQAGDTVWCKGYVMQANWLSRISTNLYIQFYTERGQLLAQQMFPVYAGMVVGQIVVPDSLRTATYYVAACTRQQAGYDSTDFFTVPLVVFNREKPGSARHRRRIETLAPSAVGRTRDLLWVTTLAKDSLYVLLQADTVVGERSLQVGKLIARDSVNAAGVTLTAQHSSRYVLFPLDGARKRVDLMLWEDSILIGHQAIYPGQDTTHAELFTDTLDNSQDGYNAWRIVFPDSLFYCPIVCVTDAARSGPQPENILSLHRSHSDDYTARNVDPDSSFLSFTGLATKNSGKRFTDFMYQQLSVIGSRDSTIVFNEVVDLDSIGRFRIDNLFFFGRMQLQFQMNNQYAYDNKNVRLTFAVPRMPRLDSSALGRAWVDDLPVTGVDTALTHEEISVRERAHMKTLQTVVVRGRKDFRSQLDDAYATGSFSEPTVYSYDLRRDSSEYNRDIFMYINSLGIRLYYDPLKDSFLDRLDHPVHVFIDEREIDAGQLFEVRALNFDELAYVKVLESDFVSTRRASVIKTPSMSPGMMPSSKMPQPLSEMRQPTPVNLLIYRRKGRDYRTMRGGMNHVDISGYDNVLDFKRDRLTLFWNLWQTGREIHIRFNNHSGAAHFRVRVEAVSKDGRVVEMERVL